MQVLVFELVAVLRCVCVAMCGFGWRKFKFTMPLIDEPQLSQHHFGASNGPLYRPTGLKTIIAISRESAFSYHFSLLLRFLSQSSTLHL